MTDPEQPAPVLAIEVAEAFVDLAASVISELELTAATARELFAERLFHVAEQRHGSVANVAVALDTSARTVHNYRKSEREPPTLAVFNARRRLLTLLGGGAQSAAQLERGLPRGSDVDYARSALRGLLTEGLVVHDEASDTYRRATDYVPWYERAGPEPNAVLRIICENLAQHFVSRYTQQATLGRAPASALAVMHRVPEDQAKAYMAELFELITEFDRRWSERQPSEGGSTMGVELVFGNLGHGRALSEVRDAHGASAEASRRAGPTQDWPTHADFVDHVGNPKDDVGSDD